VNRAPGSPCCVLTDDASLVNGYVASYEACYVATDEASLVNECFLKIESLIRRLK